MFCEIVIGCQRGRHHPKLPVPSQSRASPEPVPSQSRASPEIEAPKVGTKTSATTGNTTVPGALQPEALQYKVIVHREIEV